MILENGLIRTLDRQLPTQRALAIAGGLVAGGVGVHEPALPSPEIVDLGGRVVVPGLNDAHVHFPTWALTRMHVALDGCRSLDEALARVRDAPGQPGAVVRGYGWRSGDWPRSTEPTAERLDDVTGGAPAAMVSKDGHSLWLNSAALALAALAQHWGIVGVWIALDALIAARLALLWVRFAGRRWAVVGWS